MSIKQLNETFIYTHLNKSNALTQNISSLLSSGTTLTKKHLEEAFLTISKNFKYPLKYKVLDEFEKGNIILKFGSSRTKLPTCLPFILTKMDNRIIAVVSVDLYGTMSKDEQYVTIDPKKLYCMMESAYLAKLCYEHQLELANRTDVIVHGSAIYSAMFTRVLNKKYALNIDKTKLHKVLFLSSKFFMISCLGLKDSQVVFNYAVKNCPNGNILTLQEVNDMLSPEDYTNLETFIRALIRPELGLNFKDLTVRNYIEAFINMYDTANLLSLESFPYFLYNVMSVTNGAYINNQYVLEEIVDNHGSKIYTAMIHLDKD